MDVFVTNVGLQPSAIATALASWLEYPKADPEGIRAVVLLHTRGTYEQAQTLDNWVRRYTPVKDVLKCQVGDAMGSSDTDGDPEPASIVAELTSSFNESRIVFYADPGLKSMVVSVAQCLSPPYVRLHASDQSLQVAAVGPDGAVAWDEAPLAHLGVEGLLRLFDLHGEETLGQQLVDSCPAFLSQPIMDACRSVTGGEQRPLYQFDLQRLGLENANWAVGYEANGTLYLLVHVLPDSRPIPTTDEIIGIRHITKPLRPKVTVVAQDRYLGADVLAEAGCEVLSETDIRGLQAWFRGRTQSPGDTLPRDEQAPDTIEHYAADNPPTDLTATTLLVFMGEDPSPTLLSLRTHRPHRAVIFYDHNMRRVTLRTGWLRRIMNRLPVGEAFFVPTNREGRGIAEELCARHLDVSANFRFDFTPGTKSQACEAVRAPGVELWSQAGHLGVARRLRDGKELGLQAPELNVWAGVAAGPLVGKTVQWDLLQERKEFLWQLLQVIAKYQRDYPDAPQKLDQLLWKMTMDPACNIQRGGLHLTVSGKYTEYFPENTGKLFEEMIANALSELGPTELVTNLKLQFPEELEEDIKKRNGGIRPRRELDILARLGHHAVCISCKSSDENHEPTKSAKREIESVTDTVVGRLALPVLVRTRYTDNDKRQSWTERHGAVLLDIQDLAETDHLKEILQEIFKRRSRLE